MTLLKFCCVSEQERCGNFVVSVNLAIFLNYTFDSIKSSKAIIVYRDEKRPQLFIVQTFGYRDNRHNCNYRIIAIILNLLSILKGVD